MKFAVFVVLLTLAVVHSKEKKRISRIKCEEYNELAKTSACVSEAYPFVGAVGYEGDEGKIEWTCSGSLISNQYVLTVAHCNFSPIYGVSEVIIHPDFKRPSAYNDIALLKLDRPVQFTEFIRPACLYNGQDLPDYNVAGYNFIAKIESRRGLLVHENNSVLPEKECNNIFKPNRKMANGVDFEKQFCMNEGPVAEEINSGGTTLHGDEQLSCMQNIAGLVAIGNGRGTTVNVKVSAYIDWIENIVWS